MHVIVIGAGVVGVTTAWYLADNGHEVTVIDRASGPAMETSFANAGGVCPGFAGPWAAPGMPLKALKWMSQASAPLKIRPRADFRQWQWLARFTANCTDARYVRNKARMQRMAHYSKACLVALRQKTGIAYDHASEGVLQVFRTDDEMEAGARNAQVLAELEIPHQVLGPSDLSAVEPALAKSATTFTGGLHLTDDETGDCHLFCQKLAALLAERGVEFKFDTDVRTLTRDGGRITGVVADSGTIAADACVVATGAFAGEILRPLGIATTVYPVKGYSLTCDLSGTEDEQAACAPRSSIMDEHSKVMVTRLGSRLRAAGVAELAGFDRRLPKTATQGLLDTVRTLFPDAADYARPNFWCGFRPMTPDGPARIGATRFDNLFLNTGHGSNGWTQACGTSKVVADIVSGRQPEIEV
ncbi:D-amino acid dehydrogenase [Fodinicurvata sp. EGI_FJ10296]|uniref:D-amino acid dehydrogenase n=1 Tax=Fodinicurvata sp. EGI_FJ10296 TaxID=3231908 RepID=UPI003452C57D